MCKYPTNRKTALQVEPFFEGDGGTLLVIQIHSYELTEKDKEKKWSRSYPFDKIRNCIIRTELLKHLLINDQMFLP